MTFHKEKESANAGAHLIGTCTPNAAPHGRTHANTFNQTRMYVA